MIHRLKAIDSHTEGEPTRVVVEGWPELGTGPLAERRRTLDREHDRYRFAAVTEPRGSDVIVGAVLVEPEDPACSAGVIFFNNAGTLGMCGHGTIGLVVTLAHMGRIGPGDHRIETPVGVVSATLHRNGEVTVRNVPSHRAHRAVAVVVPGLGTVRGDVAWGGNWFFITEEHGQALELGEVDRLTDYAWRLRQAVNAQGFPEIDHIELVGPGTDAEANAKGFVLCPGRAYDRSPCGTGTSAKLACLAADGKLEEGAVWIQESIIGSRFQGSYRWVDREAGKVAPSITGAAYVMAETTLLLDERDPFCWGIRADRAQG